MYRSLSHIRFAGEPYLSTTVPALPPLKMKSLGKYKRKSSTHEILGNNSNLGAHAKPKSKVTTNSHSSVSGAATSKDKKVENKSKKRPMVEGDAIVVHLDTEPGSPTESGVDQNANKVEPFDEQISKDIALAVAMIVAEHEMLKLKYPGKYDVDDDVGKKEIEGNKPVTSKGKTVKAKKSKPKSVATEDKTGESKKEIEGVQEISQEEQLGSAPIITNSTDETKILTEKESGQNETPKRVLSSRSFEISTPPNNLLEPDSSNVANDKVLSAPTPPVVKRRPSTKRLPTRSESSMTFTVPSRTTTAVIPHTGHTTSVSVASLYTVDSSGQMTPYTPIPTLGAKMGGQLEVLKFLGRVQHYLNRLGYHRLGEPGIKINTRLSMKMQMVTAREIIQSAMPIKCLHAVVLAVYFTNCLNTVERFPIYFRSHVSAKEYKHIVLGIYVQGHFGALGISRDGGLQDKPTSYAKLSDLVFEFAKCYGQSGHILNEVKFGTIITHDPHSLERLFNKNYVVPILGCLHSDIEKNVEKFAKQLRAKMGMACLKSLRLDSSLQSRFSRSSKTSLCANSSAGSESDRSFTNIRIRALSTGPLTSNNNKEENSSRRSSKTALTRSKPAKLPKRK